MKIKSTNCNLYILIPIFLLLLELINVRYVFPITEGWWEVYAWINSLTGSLYGDYGVKFPPLYILLTSFLSNYLNLNFFESRLIFIILKLLIISFTYLWLRKYFGKIPSLIGATVPSFFIYANPVYLTKDYHAVVALFVSIILFLSSTGRANNAPNKIVIFLIGLFCSLLLLVKQNVGLFLSIGVFIYFLKLYYDFKILNSLVTGIHFIIGLIGFIIPIFFVSYFIPDWISIFSGNDSKGSIFTVIFRFLIDKNIFLQLSLAAIIVLLSLAIVRTKRFDFIFRDYRHLFQFSLVGIPILLIPISIYSSLPINIISLAWPILYLYIIVRSIDLDARLRNSWILLFLYAYCGTNTAGFNFVSIDYLIAFYYASSFYLFSKTKFAHYLAKLYSPILVLIVLCFYVVILKFSSGAGYNWWGLKSGGFFQSSVQIDHPALKNIYTDPATADMIRAALNNVSLIGSDDLIFAYPSLPILYLLSDKLPIGSPVLWFDVSSKRDASNTLDKLKVNNPKFIYWLRPPDFVYHGHFNLRKQDPGMVVVDDWLIDVLNSNKYKINAIIPSFDIDHSFKSKKFNKSLNPEMVDYDADGVKKLCQSVNGCKYNDSSYLFSSGHGYEEFLRKSLTLWQSSDHIFYVLERNSD